MECCNNCSEHYEIGYNFLVNSVLLELDSTAANDDDALEQDIVKRRKVLQELLTAKYVALDKLTEELPVMKDPEMKKLLSVLTSAIPLLFLTTNVNTLQITRIGLLCGELVLKHGICEYSSAVLTFFGWVWATFVEDTKKGTELALIGLKMAEKSQQQSNRCLAICNLFCAQIGVWRNVPHSSIIRHFEEAEKYAKRISSVSLISLTGLHDSLFRLLTGSDISEFLQRFLRLTNYVEKMKVDLISDCTSTMLPMIHYLKGENTVQSARYRTPNFKEDGGFLLALFKALHHYFSGQLTEAKKQLLVVEEHRGDYLGFHVEYLRYFVCALVYSSCFHASNNDEDKESIVLQLKQISELSGHYNRKSKGFLAPVHFFIMGELSSCDKQDQPLEAIRYFQQSLKTANSSGFNLLQVFALGRLIEIYQSNSLGDEVIVFLVTKVLNVWQSIGSTSMVSTLRSKYQEYVALSEGDNGLSDYAFSDLPGNSSGSGVKLITKPSGISKQPSVVHVNNMSFLRRGSTTNKATASSRIASFKSEILTNMKILLNKTNADRLCLIMRGDTDHNELCFETEISKSSPYPKHKQLLLSNCEHEICVGIVRKCKELNNELVVPDCHQDKTYSYDRYVKTNNVQSMACVPVLDDQEFIGILYLESTTAATKFGAQTTTLASAIIELTVQNTKMTSTMKQATSTFEKFLPKDFLAHLGTSDAEMLENSVSKQFCLMFVDFQQLVTSVDKMPVMEAFAYLNKFLSSITPAITNNHGFIHQFLGDTITALFSGSTDDCLRAAVQIITALRQLQQERKVYVNRKQPEVRIGIHYGEIKMGTVSLSETRIDTSFVSTCVPITRQLELFSKTLNTPIVVTNEVIDRLVHLRDKEDAELSYASLGKFFMKDLGITHELYHVYDKKWDAFLYSDERRKQFSKGLEMFQQRKFIMANTAFSKLHKLNDNDAISQYYGKVSKMYQQVTPPQNWDGLVLVDRDCKPNPIGSKTNSFYLQTGISAYHHFGDEQLLSNGKDKEEEIKLLNENLNQKSVTIRDMKEILSVKESEILRLEGIAEALVKEKRTETEKLKSSLEKEKARNDMLEKKGFGSGRRSADDSGSFLGKCLPCFTSPKSTRVVPASETTNTDQHPKKANNSSANNVRRRA
jgi:class 3 adenylate cyclase